MTTPPSHDWDVLERAGLSHGDFARLVPCARVTVLYWCKGTHTPGEKFVPRIEHLLNKINEKLVEGVLPIDRVDMQAAAKNERLRRIKQALS